MRTRFMSRAAIGAALIVVTTGCVKVDMDLTVSADDEVDGTFIVGVDRSLAGFTGMSEDQLREEISGELSSDLPDGGRAEPYEDDRFVGTRVTFDGVALAELEGSEAGDLSITRDGDTFVVAGELDMTEDALGTDGLEQFEGLAESVEAQVRITFPGEVTDTNGELSNSDRTVTWHPQVGELNEIRAVADAEGSGGGGVPGWLWPLAGIAALLAAGLVFMNMRRREPATEPVGVPAADYVPSPDAAVIADDSTPAPARTDDTVIDADVVDDAETRIAPAPPDIEQTVAPADGEPVESSDSEEWRDSSSNGPAGERR